VQWKNQGKSTREIATLLGRTLQSVQTQIFLLVPPQGRRFSTWTEEERHKLIELTKAGRSVEEIMESMGRTREAVVVMQRQIAGVRFKKLSPKTERGYLDWTEEEHQRLRELALAGHSIDELARLMGRTRISITVRCRRVLNLEYDRKQKRYHLPGSGSR
jgi:IS30 family transposase